MASAAGATAATDPNGWMTPGAQPGQVLVKIVGTSRETMNGQLAAVLAYMDDKGRYVVHMTKSQQQALLKPENLVKAGFLEQMQGQYELIQNHPEIKRHIQNYANLIQQTTGLKPQYVLGALVVLLLAAVYFLGFSRTLMIVTFIMLVIMVVAPDLGAPSTNPSLLVRNFPMRVRAMIRQQIPYVGPRIADNQYLSMAVVGLVLFFFVHAIFIAGGSRNKAAAAASATAPPADWLTSTTTTTAASTATSRSLQPDRTLLEEYYKMGFEDGQAGKEFGTSMPVPSPSVPPPETASAAPKTTTTARGVSTEFDDYDYSPPPPVPKAKGGFDWTILLSLLYLGRTGYSLGSTADGSWDAQLAMANLQNMQTIQKGLLAFSCYRLVTSLIRSFS